MNNKSAEIPTLSVGKVKEQLRILFGNMINSGLRYDMFPAPFLWGPPGVGKSEAIKQLAGEIELLSGKKVILTEVRLSLFSPVDLRGIPVADSKKQFSNWLMPKIFDLDKSEDIINILFVDELSSCLPSVLAASYDLILNRSLGEHNLADNVLIIAAGNRVTDHAVSYTMPSALANRMMHFEVTVDAKEWIRWGAHEGDIHPYILGFLSFDPSKLYDDEALGNRVAFPTPRSWTFVSRLLSGVKNEKDISKYSNMIAACIGNETAMEFCSYCKVFRELPDVEDIFNGKCDVVPNKSDLMYALISSMTKYAIKLAEDEESGSITNEELENVCRYCLELPADYVLTFYMNILVVDQVRKKLFKTPSFITWKKKHEKTFLSLGIFR